MAASMKSELELRALGIDMTASFAGCRKNSWNYLVSTITVKKKIGFRGACYHEIFQALESCKMLHPVNSTSENLFYRNEI